MTRTAEPPVTRRGAILPQVSGSMADQEPLKRLMLAILDRAVSDFRTYAAVPTGRGRRLFTDVDTWFSSPACGPFDFETVCQATGLDADYIRKGVGSSRPGSRPTSHDERGAKSHDRSAVWPLF